MKTIRMTFIKAGKVVARAEAQFTSEHGTGPVSWSGDLEPHLLPEFKGLTTLPTLDAYRYAWTMARIATANALEVEVEASGDYDRTGPSHPV